jgi:phosphotransferase system HPr (HPr) family protein
MKKKEVTLKAPNGLHARPASELVRIASGFKASVEIENKTLSLNVNAKSILSMLTLGAAYGTELVVQTTGPDEEGALDAVVGYLLGLKE